MVSQLHRKNLQLFSLCILTIFKTLHYVGSGCGQNGLDPPRLIFQNLCQKHSYEFEIFVTSTYKITSGSRSCF
jgi:hypothetical protein